MTQLFRYLSEREVKALLKGDRIFNNTNHSVSRGKATTASGFCFGTCADAADAARQLRRLSGIVDAEYLLVGSVTKDTLYLFQKCQGRYIDFPEVDRHGGIMAYPIGQEPCIYIDEYCRTAYALALFSDFAIYRVDGYESKSGKAILSQPVIKHQSAS